MKIRSILSTFVGLSLLLMGSMPAQAETITSSFAVGSVGGTFYTWGAAMSKLVDSHVPGVKLAVEATGGGSVGPKMIQREAIDYCLFAVAPMMVDSKKGYMPSALKNYSRLRVLFPMYPSFFTYWALEKSGMKTFRDLNGKVFCGGPKTSATTLYTPLFLADFGLKLGKQLNSGMGELDGLMTDGIIDAAGAAAGNPNGPTVETDSVSPVSLLDFTDEELAAIVKKYPILGTKLRKAGNYKNSTEDKNVLIFWNYFGCSKDIPDEVAYNITKAFFENINEFAMVNPPTLETRAEDILDCPIPLHPGAVKYYREIGLNIPDSLIAK